MKEIKAKGSKYMKKTISALLAAVMLTGTAYASGFTDITGHWAENDINILADKGIVNGVADGVFDAEGTVTRVQYLKMVMESVGMETVQYREGECLDAAAEDWYAPYLQSVLDKGLVPEAMVANYKSSVIVERDDEGNAVSSSVTYSGQFNGNVPITREEAAYLAMSIAQYMMNPNTMKNLEGTSVPVFTDVMEISSWAYPSVNLAAICGVITGMDTGSFRPQDTATRAQAAVIMNRLIKLMEAE